VSGDFDPPITAVREAVARALAEDLGVLGDLTSTALIAADAAGTGHFVARRPGVLAGTAAATEVFAQLDPAVTVTWAAGDGEPLSAGQRIGTVNGPLRSVLTGERSALNFLGHLSGIATATNAYVRKVGGGKTRICCTRKTTPGLRALEKYAVRCGGGFNHRFGLDDAILIKDNHVAVAGGIRAVLERARAAAGHLVKIEIEVDSLDQLNEVLDCGLADVVLIDNFDVASMKKAVGLVAGRLVIEASGGITLDNIAEIAATGVDYASSGALTHSAPALDIGLDIEIQL